MKLGDWLKHNQVTRADFARRIGVSPGAVKTKTRAPRGFPPPHRRFARRGHPDLPRTWIVAVARNRRTDRRRDVWGGDAERFSQRASGAHWTRHAQSRRR